MSWAGRWVLILAGVLVWQQELSGAIGCTLSNPARDLRTLFPEMTSYREDVRELTRMPDGREVYEALKQRVGSDLDPVYEAFDTPYTLYAVFKEQELLSYVHGVNVPGRGGVIQLFVTLDPKTAVVNRLFYQRLESPGGRLLRARATVEQFKGLTLADFYKHDYFALSEEVHPSDKVAQLKSPAGLPEGAVADWEASLRGLRKNLILMDLLVFERRFEVFYERAREAAAKELPGK